MYRERIWGNRVKKQLVMKHQICVHSTHRASCPLSRQCCASRQCRVSETQYSLFDKLRSINPKLNGPYNLPKDPIYQKWSQNAFYLFCIHFRILLILHSLSTTTWTQSWCNLFYLYRFLHVTHLSLVLRFAFVTLFLIISNILYIFLVGGIQL